MNYNDISKHTVVGGGGGVKQGVKHGDCHTSSRKNASQHLVRQSPLYERFMFTKNRSMHGLS